MKITFFCMAIFLLEFCSPTYGSFAILEQFPFMASIQKVGEGHRCSGVIIHPRWVVTAEHCVSQKHYNSLFQVLVRTVNVNEGKIYRIVKKISYSDESSNTFPKHDISLIKADSDMTFYHVVKPIEMSGEHIGEGLKARVTGW